MREGKNAGRWLKMILCAVCLTGILIGCSRGGTPVDETAGGYYGRDCVMYDAGLYWDSGIWHDGQEDALPEDALEVGEITASVDAIPTGQLEAALLPAGTPVYASASSDSLFIEQDGGYVQYRPMEGMEEKVEEALAVRPTGEDPGYEYAGEDYIYHGGSLYREGRTLQNEKEVPEDREELGHILCRADAMPDQELHSAASDAGDVVYQSETYPDSLLVWHRQRDVWQLYEVSE